MTASSKLLVERDVTPLTLHLYYSYIINRQINVTLVLFRHVCWLLFTEVYNKHIMIVSVINVVSNQIVVISAS